MNGIADAKYFVRLYLIYYLFLSPGSLVLISLMGQREYEVCLWTCCASHNSPTSKNCLGSDQGGHGFQSLKVTPLLEVPQAWH